MTATHPFTDIEARLLAPPEDGIMVTSVTAGSPAATAGLVPGDIVVRIDDADTAPDRQAFQQAIRKLPDGPAQRTFHVLGADGARRAVAVTLPFAGAGVCAVKAGQPGWDDSDDVGEPDYSGLADGVDIYMRNSMEETRAGHEILRVRPAGDGLIEVEILFRLGGDDGQGGTWDYNTRGTATLRLAPGLPAVRTAFWEGERLVGDVRLSGDTWRGEKDGPDGTRVPVEHPAAAPVATAYTLTLVPLTMPLHEGSRLTVCSTGDGVGLAQGRLRFECVGRETVKVDGADVDAWCIVQRHYGLETYGGDERFYVTDERRLVRVDWGPNYAGCSGEAVPVERLNDGVPEHVHCRPAGLSG